MEPSICISKEIPRALDTMSWFEQQPPFYDMTWPVPSPYIDLNVIVRSIIMCQIRMDPLYPPVAFRDRVIRHWKDRGLTYLGAPYARMARGRTVPLQFIISSNILIKICYPNYKCIILMW